MIGISRAEILENETRARRIGLVAVDRAHLEQREVALPLLGRTHLAADRIARSEVESLDLRRRHVNVVRAVEVAPVLTAQEPVPLGQNLQYPFAAEHDLLIEQALLDAKNQVLLSQARGLEQAEAGRQRQELCDRLAFEFDDVHANWGLEGSRSLDHYVGRR